MGAARVGLVLGAGGVVGGAFHAGVLSALAEATGFDPRAATLVVGTSAGSLTGAFLRAGLSAQDLAARARGDPLSREGERLLGRLEGMPSFPALELGDFARGSAEPRVLLRAGLRPWRVRPGALAAALLPEGRTPWEPIQRLVDRLHGDRWAKDPFWVCALELSEGRRVVFGQAGSPESSVGRAVAASCAIPGVFRPVRIGAARYVDGGAHSPTNLDVVRPLGLDLVIVSSPMSVAGGRYGLGADLPVRILCRGRLVREAASVRRSGTPVVAFQPTDEDRRAMGLDPMDPARRARVTAQVHESTLRRLARADVRARLAPIGA